MKPTDGAEGIGYYVYPFIFNPSKFKNITKEGFERKLNENGIPTDDCYPPLHRLTCFRESLLREKIDYTQANWGGNKSDDALFPVVSDIYERSLQLPHYVLLADRGKLDYIAQTIEHIRY
jgi:dTDP-4-amino-4,6-dideoxygalactose transaminase